MAEWIQKFKDIPVTAVSDGLKGYNHLWPGIKPVKPTQKVVGYAKTVQIPPGDNKLVLQAIRDARPNEVLIVDAGGYIDRATAGDFIMGLAQMMGFTGAIINGAVRDIQGIRDLDFPVFCTGATPAAGFKHGNGTINEPTSCNGVVIHPGD
ncbi:Demethylmenaquinone methyltransferase [Salinibacillus kushneri]|uniref:Putative 4-hydroxy-4-methyl-2-oxoglutarate aldolase n=1 Tax=Salinibacillus kushneri TaxID=237682 RepID=A0A1H9YXE3_9BACI|nr:RraA family protein [Salinibacillus kushneri]SES73847.1 Demethylmenaquinone methyltransferase [Salinibacillus kushneri]